MAFLRHSVLAMRILIWALLASFVVFAAATSFGVMHEREKAFRQAHAAAGEAVRQSLPAVSVALWQYDSAGLQALAQGMAQVGSVLQVEVLDRQKVVAAARSGQAGQSADRVWTERIWSPDGKQEIGALRLTESYEQLEAQIDGTLRTLMATELAKIVGLAFVLLVIVYRKVARHLHQLADDVTHLGDLDQVPQVGIARRKVGSYRDELDVLVDAINRFLRDRAHESQRRSAAEVGLRARVSEIETTMGALSDGVIALDRACRVRYANAAACTLLDRPAAAMTGSALDAVLSLIDDSSGAVLSDLCAGVVAGGEAVHLRGRVSIRTAAGRPFEARISAVPVPDSGEVAMIFVFTDISEEMQKERKIEFQAYHDPLTRLGNRSLLARDLPREIDQARRDGLCLAVLCLDLDNFKNINDSLGHLLGDVMLKQLASRFAAAVGAPGWVTRHGGDEFIVVLPRLASVAPALELAERLMRSIAEPFAIDGHDLRITSSIGISLCPEHGTSIGQLVSHADLAMYAAKQQGKNACRVYEESLLRRSTERLQMENRLRVALQQGQFALVFQPQVDLASGRIDSAEALLRWQCPGVGAVPPTAFIPVAEDAGLIIGIGDWVLREALAAAQRLHTQLGRKLAIAVNVSPVQFRSEALLATLGELAARVPDLADLIEIELTETALSGEVADVVAKLEAIKRLGLRIAIDDFGTGYSSLAYLKTFPIDILKVDQAFIRDLPNSRQDQAIVASIIQLGHNLGFRIVAEGVEEAEHARLLGDLACDTAQGYWYARPMPESALPAWFAAREA